jgi:hypothetical protein
LIFSCLALCWCSILKFSWSFVVLLMC